MLTNDFQRIAIALFILVLVGLVAYGIYCNRKVRSYAGTGRVADIEIWYFKATVTWIATFGLAFYAVVSLV
jgi:hypothetical protein